MRKPNAISSTGADLPVALPDLEMFRAALARGLGRAVVSAREARDPRPFRDATLHACTHDLRYDRQCESARAQYHFDLVQATDEPEYYRERLLSVLCDSSEEDEIELAFGTLARFVVDGDTGIAPHLYDAVDSEASKGRWGCSWDLLEIAGMEAFLFLADRFCAQTEPSDEDWPFRSWLDVLEEQLGPESATAQVNKAAESRPNLASWLDRSKANDDANSRKRDLQPRDRSYSYRQVMRMISDRIAREPGGYHSGLRRVGRRASRRAIMRLADELETESDPDRLVAIAQVFGRRAFPNDPARLVGLVRSGDERFCWVALGALEHVIDSRAREAALTVIENPAFAGRAVDVLVHNYQPGDERYVERALQLDLDDFQMHGIQMAAPDLFRENPRAGYQNTLLRIYATGPCTLCREKVVKLLAERSALPDWMQEECRWDCSLEIRKLVSTP